MQNHAVVLVYPKNMSSQANSTPKIFFFVYSFCISMSIGAVSQKDAIQLKENITPNSTQTGLLWINNEEHKT